MENLVHQSVSILAGLVLLVSSTVSALPSKVHDFTNKFAYQQTNVAAPARTAPTVAPAQPATTSQPAKAIEPKTPPQQSKNTIGKTLAKIWSRISNGFSAVVQFIGFGKQPSSLAKKDVGRNNPSVLAATIDRAVTGVSFTIPVFFKDLVKLDTTLEVSGDTTLQNLEVNGPSTFNAPVTLTNQDLDLGTGELTASNVLYGLTGGNGIKISTGQTPEVSLNVDYVKSIEGLTGDISLEEGSGITIDGTTITNSDKGSSQSIFKTFSVSGQDDIVADSNTDTLTLVAGTGVTLTSSASTDAITIDASTASLNSGWADDGSIVRLVTSTDKVGIGTSSPSQALDVGGLFVVDTANSFVGIGTTAPAYTLDNAGTLRVAGASTLGTLNAGATTLSSLNNSSGGITNAGAITGATGLTSTGTITFGSLGAGIAHLSSAGVLSSSAVNLANSDVTGTLPTTSGGTGLTSYTTGDLLYGSATNTIGRIGVGGSGQVLTVAGGIPTWASITGGGGGGGGLCANCLITDPGSTQTIVPTGSGTTGLAIRQTNGGGSGDIFKVSSSDGSTNYLRVDSSGNVVLGTGSSTGVFTVNPSSTDPIAISPVTQGAGAFTGTITSADLTAARIWTLPNATGSVCLDTGNCAGSGSNLGGSGTANYVTRWNSQYVLENGTIFDNGNIGIGTTNPLTKLEVADTAWLRGSSSTNGLYVASNGNVGIGTTSAAYGLDVAGTTNISGAVTLGSTLNVTGATTILSSTMSITGTTTIGGNLQVNGAGSSWVMGNFGIGTSSPTSNLTFGMGAATIGMATSTNALTFGSGLLNFDTTNGRVGVGVSVPSAKFQVRDTSVVSDLLSGSPTMRIDGGTGITNGTTATIGFGSNAADGYTSTFAKVGAQFFGGAQETALFFGTSSNTNAGINQIPLYLRSNRVGIGTTVPQNRLDVSGSVAFGSLPTTALPQSNSAYFSGNIGIATTNPGANLDIGSSATTGTGIQLTSNSLTTGKGLYITSTSTGLSTGSLASIDWSPGSSTTATGDILSVNVGANGVVGNIFNVKDNSTSVFSVSQTAITAGLPVNFQAPGDVAIAYDINFTNQTASYIKSNAPLTIEVGESWESNDLTLRTYNVGQLVLDLPAGLSTNQAQRWTFATSAQALNINNGLINFDTTNSRIGIGTSDPRNRLDVSGSVAFGSLPTNPLPQSNSAYFSGNVGLGTSNPGTTLDVTGTGRFSSTFTASNGLTMTTGALNLTASSGTVALTLGSSSTAFNVNAGLLNLNTANSYVGIGTTSPRNKFEVSGSVAFGSLPMNPLPQANSAYFSGRVGIGTTNPATSLEIVGGNCSDDAGGGGCTSDYAELYPSSEDVQKGDVLMIDPANTDTYTVKRADKAYANNLIGIVSSAPAAIADGSKFTFMNTEYKLDPRRPAVALAGRVPARVDPDSPEIKAGDGLTSSNKPGMLMKATKAGNIIGKALERWVPGTGKEKVLVFVNNTWFDPSLALNENGEVYGVASTMAQLSPDRTDAVAKDLAKVTGQLDTLASSVSNLDSKVSGVETNINQLTTENADLTNRVNKLDELVAQLQSNGSILGIGSSSPNLVGSDEDSEDALATADLIIDGQKGEFSELRVSGLAKMNDINVIGDATIGFLQLTGMDLAGGSAIDTIAGPLRLQSTALNDLDIMNGKVLVQKDGNIVTTGQITAKKLNISSEIDAVDNSVGTGVLEKGTKKIVIETTAVTKDSRVFITPKTVVDYPLVVTVVEPQTGFTVEMKDTEDKDIKFDWWVVN